MTPAITREMKSRCSAEFEFTITAVCGQCIDQGLDINCVVCGGEIMYQQLVTVPWDTCKEIYIMMSDYAPKPLAPKYSARMGLAAEAYWNPPRITHIFRQPRTWAGVYQAMIDAARKEYRESGSLGSPGH